MTVRMAEDISNGLWKVMAFLTIGAALILELEWPERHYDWIADTSSYIAAHYVLAVLGLKWYVRGWSGRPVANTWAARQRSSGGQGLPIDV